MGFLLSKKTGLVLFNRKQKSQQGLYILSVEILK